MTNRFNDIAFITLILCVIAQGQIQFNDATESYEVGGTGQANGVAIFDYDNDGLEDIYVVTNESTISNILYKNQGEQAFQNVTSEANLTLNAQGYAISAGDYDNDGWEDIFTSYHGSDDNQVYKNIGGTPVSYSPLTSQISGDMDNAGATWLDYNKDGLLDLFLMDHHGQGGGFFLYQNNGNDSFTRDTLTLPLTVTGSGQCVIAADLNNDGDTDLYITSYDQEDSESTYLEYDALTNEFEKKRFAGGALNSGIMQAQGVTTGDYNNDGWLDLYIANDGGSPENCQDRIYLNSGYGTYTEDETAGIIDNTLSYSPQFADFDNDGWLDIYIVKKNANNKLYHNDGDGTFSDVTGTIDPINWSGTSSAVGDINDDGKLDIYIGNYATPNILLVNSSNNNNHFIKIKLEGTQSNRSALNARVSLYETGHFSQMREITGSSGCMSQNSKSSALWLGGVKLQWLKLESSGPVAYKRLLML